MSVAPNCALPSGRNTDQSFAREKSHQGDQRYCESDVQKTGIPALTARDVTWRRVRR